MHQATVAGMNAAERMRRTWVAVWDGWRPEAEDTVVLCLASAGHAPAPARSAQQPGSRQAGMQQRRPFAAPARRGADVDRQTGQPARDRHAARRWPHSGALPGSVAEQERGLACRAECDEEVMQVPHAAPDLHAPRARPRTARRGRARLACLKGPEMAPVAPMALMALSQRHPPGTRQKSLCLG